MADSHSRLLRLRCFRNVHRVPSAGRSFLLLAGLLATPPSFAQSAADGIENSKNPTTESRKGFSLSDKDRSHWSFQPVQSPAVPTDAAHPIDAFLQARLKSQGLKSNPITGKRERIRRAYYDLTGLPPSPKEVEDFEADASPKAWENLIDRLLDSPHYGEKWGRHWLDLVRFAESNSYERDGAKPHAWRYRDYIIRSFNADKPYDRFLREQLAGDEFPDPNPDAITATGYYRLGVWDDEPADRELARLDSLDDLVTTTSQVFLGLTVDCARCHNHKLDPIPQSDYYRLLSFFNNVNPYKNGGPTDELELFNSPAERESHQNRIEELNRQRADAKGRVTEFETRIREELARETANGLASTGGKNKPTEEQARRVLGTEIFATYTEAKKSLESLQQQSPPVEKALAVTEAGTNAPETFILLRGNPNLKGDRVEPGFLQVLGGPEPTIPPPGKNAKSSGRRTVLANWIASRDNPLTARVMVNRIWQHHFGRGIVTSPNNFGFQGDKPTHPQLLDWLAREFIHSGWSMKAMHRLIMTSAAYQLSSQGQSEALKVDPANDLIWRFNMRRLTAEEIRDSFLVITGTLNPKMYGPGVYVEIPKEVLAGQSVPGNGWGHSSEEEQARRSIYIFAKRSLITPILESFDLAETDRSSPVRFTTLQPTQALGTLNSQFLNREAGILADRLKREAGAETRAQVRLALYLATSRTPTEKEIRRGTTLIETLQSQDHSSPETALKYFCLMVLNLNELLYLD
ncbi:MAG: DUF1553 domain-containing protein [Pedosphaera sp.]|nr:DUF1553 domain-containing protein [Pedosphaera sp.]